MKIQQHYICMGRGIWVFFSSLSFIETIKSYIIILKRLLSLNILLCAIIIHKQCNVQPLHVLISSNWYVLELTWGIISLSDISM